MNLKYETRFLYHEIKNEKNISKNRFIWTQKQLFTQINLNA